MNNYLYSPYRDYFGLTKMFFQGSQRKTECSNRIQLNFEMPDTSKKGSKNIQSRSDIGIDEPEMCANKELCFTEEFPEPPESGRPIRNRKTPVTDNSEEYPSSEAKREQMLRVRRRLRFTSVSSDSTDLSEDQSESFCQERPDVSSVFQNQTCHATPEKKAQLNYFSDSLLSLRQLNSTRKKILIRSTSDEIADDMYQGFEERRGRSMVCVFCKKNGETVEYYTTHLIKDNRGKVVCPILRRYRCPNCSATGDTAHTLRHCPQSGAGSGSIVETFKTPRMSYGLRR